MKKACAHYISTYLPLTENWIYNLIKNLDEYEPIMLSRKTLNLDKFPISSLQSLSDLSKVNYLYNFAVFKTKKYFPFFKNVCIKNKVNILHVHFGYHGIKSIALKRRLKIPMLCSFYGNDAYINKHNGAYFNKLESLFREADKILTLGPRMSQQLQNLGCPAHKLHVHHLGVDLDKIKFKPRSLPKKDKVRFLIACSFIAKKGIDDALKALKLIKDKVNFTLDIIGDGYLNEEIGNLIKSLDLSKQVTLHGYQPYHKVIEYAYNSHLLLQASKTTANNDKEGTPIIFADVMATGLPVISTKHSDIPEMVLDGTTGYLAQENSPQDFSESILKIVNNNKFYESCSRQSRAHIEKEFNVNIQSGKLEKIYNELI